MIKKLAFLILFALFLTQVCLAEENVQKEINEHISDEMSDFKGTLPEYVTDFLGDEVFEGDFSSLTNGEINQSTFIDYVINYILFSLPSITRSFSSLLILILLISIFNLLKSSFSSEGLKNAFSTCASLSLCVSVFSIVGGIVDTSIDYVGTLCDTMNTFAPVMSAMYIMTGSISSAAVSNASMMLFLSIVENFIVIALVPIIKICLCFSLVGSISGGIDLSEGSKMIKNTFTGICVFLMSIFSFVMSYQGVLTQGADTLTIRTARFAVGNFIPIVGGFVGESLKTVSSSLSLVKGSCGVIAIIVIVVLTLPVIASLLLYRLSFGIISTLSRILGIGNETRCCDEAGTLCSFILAILSLTFVVFIFALTIFIKSSGGMG
jgi:stage III sporulation protein AE